MRNFWYFKPHTFAYNARVHGLEKTTILRWIFRKRNSWDSMTYERHYRTYLLNVKPFLISVIERQPIMPNQLPFLCFAILFLVTLASGFQCYSGMGVREGTRPHHVENCTEGVKTCRKKYMGRKQGQLKTVVRKERILIQSQFYYKEHAIAETESSQGLKRNVFSS